METRAGYMVVGTFVLLAMAGILGFFLWLAKSDLDYKVKYYTIYFPGSVTGLTIGGSVSYLGVNVGTIKNIELDVKNLERVNVTVTIKDSIPIKENAYSSLEMQGLTGYKLVQIYGGSKESPLLKRKPGEKYPVIPARYSGVEEIMTTLPRMVNKFTNLVDRINATFNEKNRNHFSNTLKNVDTLSKHLAESAEPIKNLINHTNTAVQTFDREFQSISRASEKTLARIDEAASEVSGYLKNNKVALDSMTQSGSYELIQTLNDTRAMLSRATRFFEKLDENPRSLIFETQRKGVSVPQQ